MAPEADMDSHIALDELQLTEDIDLIAAVVERAVPAEQRARLLSPASPQLLRVLPDKAMVSLALLADCLQVAHATMIADGSISQDEIDAAFPLLFLASKWYARSIRGYQPFTRLTHDDSRGFLSAYERDTSPFGYAHRDTRWLGLELCRHAAVAGDGAALDVYEQMILRLMDALARVAGTSVEEKRARARVEELLRVRRSLAQAATVESGDVDRRVKSFLTPGLRVFTSVAQAHSVWDRDPFDIETVHADVRSAFDNLVDRAVTPIRHDHGRILLVLGESGSGKTHLLRAFRADLHGRRLGYACYAQLHSRADDYAHYLLGNLVDSLGQPYDRPADERSALLLLSNGLLDLLGSGMAEQVEQLRAGEWPDQAALGQFVSELADELLTVEDLVGFDPDFLRVMLCLQRRDPKTTTRVVKYLRCENMNAYDRAYLADAVPRTGPDDAMRMIAQIGRLAWITQGGALVLLVDQVEDSFAADGALSFQRAVDTLRRLVEFVPSAVAVIACLDDLWRTVRPTLTNAALDRLERDPPVHSLVVNRSYEEIEAIVARRLSWLYGQTGATFRDDDPLFPVPAGELRARTNRRTRDVLDYCHRFREACIGAGAVLPGIDGGGREPTPIVTPALESRDLRLDAFDIAWNDAHTNPALELPEEETALLGVLEDAARFCDGELAGQPRLRVGRSDDLLTVDITLGSHVRRLAIGITNKGFQRGAFARQIETLRAHAGDRTPIAVRTTEYPAGKPSHQAISALRQAGGRNLVLSAGDLRALVAMSGFAPSARAEQLARWRADRRPIASLPSVRAIFDLDDTPDEVPAVTAPAAAHTPTASPMVSTEPTAPHRREREATRPPPAGEPLVGHTVSFRREPVTVTLPMLCRHTAVLGAPGSGKTTLALNLVEQAAARGVAIVLVDRKGDLAAYARPAWWKEPAGDLERNQRKQSLAERVDVRLFTPGNEVGRTLAFDVVPRTDGVPSHEASRLVAYAAHALASMMKLGDAGADGSRRAILREAVAVLAEHGEHRSLPSLIDLIHERGPDLVARVPRFDDKHFARLVNDLETLRVSHGDLFDDGAEQLAASTLLEPAADGRSAFTVVSTKFLGDQHRVQFWVARLLVELSRWASRAPSETLQALVMFDEADLYLPAGASKPSTKEPMQDLLRRGRSGGVGVMLASQSPGDFDYRVRDLITTWFVGKIGDKRSIDKMKPLFEGRAGVAAKLAQQATGRFIAMGEGTAREIAAEPSLMKTEQLSEVEILELASAGRQAAAR
jgi:hypothetical protein